MTALKYVIIISDDAQRRYEVKRSKDMLIEVFPVGYLFCGLHFNGSRPTTVVRAYTPRTDEKFISWERVVLGSVGGMQTNWI